MDTFAAIIETLNNIRENKYNITKSVKHISRFPTLRECGWCLEGLSIEAISDVKPSEHISSLYILECRKLKTLRGIEKFPLLQSVWIYGCNDLVNIDGLQALNELENLTIWPSFSGNITLETLTPLAEATALKRLEISGKTKDGSLKALSKLPHLITLFLSNSFRWEEFAQFEAHQPTVAFPWKGGVVYNINPSLLKCSACGGAQAMLTGKRQKLCCPSCEVVRLNQHLLKYSRMSAS